MRILVLSTWFPFPPDNGAKLRAYYLIRALARHHTVTVVAFNPGGELGSPNHAFSLSGVDVHAVGADPFCYVDLPAVAKFASPVPLAYWPSRIMRHTVTQLRKAEHWDAVVAIQIPVAQYVLSWPIPRIVDVDTGLAYQMRERMRAARGWVGRIRAFVSWKKAQQHEARIVRRYGAATVATNHEVDLLRSMVRQARCRVVVVSNGVDVARNHLGVASRRPNSLVYNGALGYTPNYDAMRYFLAEIYPLIKQKIPDVSMTITGSTRNVDLVGLALDDSVTLTGYVDDVRIPVASAAVCVVPLRQGGGTRTKILEAMALGTPVATTSKGAEGLSMVDGETGVIADSPERFAAQTVLLLQREDMRQRIATGARQLVEDTYDWERIGQGFANLVAETVGSFSAARRTGCGESATPDAG